MDLDEDDAPQQDTNEELEENEKFMREYMVREVIIFELVMLTSFDCMNYRKRWTANYQVLR